MRVKFDYTAKKNLLNNSYILNEFPIHINEGNIIEVGMGKGLMLLHLAIKYPDITFIGIEKNETIAWKAITLFKENKINNIKVIVADVNNLLNILDGKVNQIYITFPDPWPKKKHEKRKLTSSSFINIYKNILNKNGIIKFKTDNDELYKYTLNSFKKNNMEIIFQTNDLHNSIKNNENIYTSYEIKWSSLGKNINYIEAKF